MAAAANYFCGAMIWIAAAGGVTAHAAESDYLRRHQQKQPVAPAPEIYDIKHGIVHYDKGTYCGHPRQVVFEYFGNGEMIVGHNHAPTNYAKRRTN